MSWLYVPASEGLNLECASPSPTPAPSASWRGKPLQPRSWSRACKTAPWTKLLSGATLPPSMAARGVASWISSLRDTRASRSPSQGSATGQAILATSGHTLPGSYRNAPPQQSFWKMSLGTSRWGSPKSDAAWRTWATALLREYSAQRRSGRTTSGGGYSWSHLMPTPTSCDHKGSGRHRIERGQNNNLRDYFKIRYGMLYPPVRVVEWMMGLPGGHTDFKPLGGASSRWLEVMRSELYRLSLEAR